MIHTILKNRFNKTGNLIYMATANDNIPSIRSLTPFYQNGAFYVISDVRSSKIRQITNNPNVAICGYFFNASAKAINIGPMTNYPNLKKELCSICEEWIQLGKVDVDSKNTIILKLEIQKGYVIHENKRYEIDFS